LLHTELVFSYPGFMADRSDDNGTVEEASREVARAIWQTVLLARDEHRARGLIGKVTRQKLVDKILELIRVARRR
jgi:hypothetical protein